MKERILNIMNEVFDIDCANEETSQSNCETWDSMNQLNLIISLEAEFDVSFEPEEIGVMRNYKEVEQILKSKLA